MGFLWVLVQIICAPSIFILIVALSQFRFSKRTTIISTALMAALLFLLDYWVVSTVGRNVDARPLLDFAYRITNIAVAAVFAVCLIRQRADKTLFIVLSVCVGTYIVDTIALTLRTLFGLYPLELALELLLYPIIIIIFLRLRNIFLEVMAYMNEYLLPLCLAPAFLLVCFLLQISIPNRLENTPENIPAALLLCCVAVTVYVLFFHLFRAVHAKSVLEHNAMAMKFSVSSLENRNQLAAQNEKRAMLFKHDLRHIAQMLAGCLDSGDISSARELLASLESNIGAWGTQAIQSFSGHKLLDATLCHYSDLAKESGILFTVSMTPMDDIKADMTELSVVMANALENAVAACNGLPEDVQRVIRLDGHRRGRQYFLELVNTCGSVHLDPVTGTPVSDKAGHGLGSQSIAYFAKKNHAVLQYQYEKDWFHLRLLMKA